MPPHIMISGVFITVRDLDPKTLPVIHVTPHYKRRKICIHREKLSNQALGKTVFTTGRA